MGRPVLTSERREEPGAAPGWDVLRAGLEEAQSALGERLVAGYALGSLAHGGFAAAVSDVDLALIVDRLDAAVGPVLERVRERVMVRLKTPLAARLSIFWSSWEVLRADREGGRFPLLDRLDLMQSGVLLLGADRRDEVALPSGEAQRRRLIVEAAEFMLERLARGPGAPLPLDVVGTEAFDCRQVTKALLFPVRFIYTAEVGGFATNQAAADHYGSRPGRPAKALVSRAMRWRTSGELDSHEEVRSAMLDGLVPLYDELTRVYSEAARDAGRADLEARLREWRRELSMIASPHGSRDGSRVSLPRR